ncbi:MAG: cytochrome c family protein [Proteobacteria bacterium]|nr:cytochrome c family protein [Pseudomonadota bacterium]
MKNRRTTISLIILFSFFVFSGMGALTATESPEEVIVDSDVYDTDRKGPVVLSHRIHAEDYDVACKECHHDYDEDGKSLWEEGDPVEKCGSCHDPSVNEGNMKKLRIAFHINCKGCHKRMKKEGISDDAPYRNCYDCHKRKL